MFGLKECEFLLGNKAALEKLLDGLGDHRVVERIGFESRLRYVQQTILQERRRLLSEKAALSEMLSEMDEDQVLDRVSLGSRLEVVEEVLKLLPQTVANNPLFFLATIEAHFADQTLVELRLIEGMSEICAEELLDMYTRRHTDLERGYYFQTKSLKQISPEDAKILEDVAYVDRLPNIPDPNTWKFMMNVRKGGPMDEMIQQHIKDKVGGHFWWGDPQNCPHPEDYQGLYRHKN